MKKFTLRFLKSFLKPMTKFVSSEDHCMGLSTQADSGLGSLAIVSLGYY